MTFLPHRQQQAQHRIRAEQSTGHWRRQYALRCGVESLISQASRLSDVHHARYRGKPKTFLQHTLTAMAINLQTQGSSGRRGAVPGDLEAALAVQAQGVQNRADATAARSVAKWGLIEFRQER